MLQIPVEVMMKKRGQMQMSFTMIFSIILIIATIGIAVYVISQFFIRGECTKTQIFYDDLRNKIEGIYRSASAKEKYIANVPSGIELLCFGEPDKINGEYTEVARELRRYSGNEKNAFLYPIKSCGSFSGAQKIENVKIDKSFCIKVVERKVSINLQKESNEPLVKIIQ